MRVMCGVEAVENGLVVRFERVKKQKRQADPSRPNVERIARHAVQELKRAIRPDGESWKGDESTPEPGAAEPAKLEEVYVLEPAAIFCGDDASLIAAVKEARKAEDEAAGLGLLTPAYAPAVGAGIGLSQFR